MKPNFKKGFVITPNLEDYSGDEVIEGVRLVQNSVFTGDGGDFAEITRINKDGITVGKGSNLIDFEGFAPRQISRSYLMPGLIKAFHIHSVQNEIFFPTQGRFLIGLYDNRENSPTKGVKMRIYAGEDRQIGIYIPSGVAHGYRNIGLNKNLLIYVTDQQWSGEDEGRIPWDSKQINFDWEVHNG